MKYFKRLLFLSVLLILVHAVEATPGQVTRESLHSFASGISRNFHISGQAHMVTAEGKAMDANWRDQPQRKRGKDPERVDQPLQRQEPILETRTAQAASPAQPPQPSRGVAEGNRFCPR